MLGTTDANRLSIITLVMYEPIRQWKSALGTEP
jgi:hypothetical protein